MKYPLTKFHIQTIRSGTWWLCRVMDMFNVVAFQTRDRTYALTRAACCKKRDALRKEAIKKGKGVKRHPSWRDYGFDL